MRFEAAGFGARSLITMALALSFLVAAAPAMAKKSDLFLRVRAATSAMDRVRALLEVRRAFDAKYPSSAPCGDDGNLMRAQQPIPNYTATYQAVTLRCGDNVVHTLYFSNIHHIVIYRSRRSNDVPQLLVATEHEALTLFFSDEAAARIAANAFYLLIHPDQLATPQTEPQFQASVAIAKTSGDRTEGQRRAQVQAEALLNMNRSSETALLYREALTTSPDWSQGHYNLALVYGSLKLYPEAITEMRRYLFLDPNATDARAAQDQIYGWEAKSGGL